jgi:hypothetical protein
MPIAQITEMPGAGVREYEAPVVESRVHNLVPAAGRVAR